MTQLNTEQNELDACEQQLLNTVKDDDEDENEWTRQNLSAQLVTENPDKSLFWFSNSNLLKTLGNTENLNETVRFFGVTENPDNFSILVFKCKLIKLYENSNIDNALHTY
ncbi:MAG: hypothetical protein GY861_05320 [bacterium]|nr:hypothetical protein [bacterium]